MYIMKVAASIVGAVMIFFTGQAAHGGPKTAIPAQLPVKGMVTMIDLGATKCIPCKMMAPILKELEGKYRGRAAIIFIDVWENEGMDKKFGIRTIPTQIFYDHTGKEVFRHEGFLERKYIVQTLAKLGVPLEAKAGLPTVPPPVTSNPTPNTAPVSAPMAPRASQAQPAPQINPYQPMPVGAGSGMAAGLLSPGSVNLLWLDTNVSQPKEQVWKVFGALEKEYPQKVTLLVLDANTNRDMINNLSVRSVPTLIVYDPGGREAARYPGMPGLPELQAVLAQIIKK